MDWHVPPSTRVFAIREQLAHEVFQCEATLLENPCLPVLGENYVLGKKS